MGCPKCIPSLRSNQCDARQCNFGVAEQSHFLLRNEAIVRAAFRWPANTTPELRFAIGIVRALNEHHGKTPRNPAVSQAEIAWGTVTRFRARSEDTVLGRIAGADTAAAIRNAAHAHTAEGLTGAGFHGIREPRKARPREAAPGCIHGFDEYGCSCNPGSQSEQAFEKTPPVSPRCQRTGEIIESSIVHNDYSTLCSDWQEATDRTQTGPVAPVHCALSRQCSHIQPLVVVSTRRLAIELPIRLPAVHTVSVATRPHRSCWVSLPGVTDRVLAARIPVFLSCAHL